LNLSDASKHRLTVAKEMYSHGYAHSTKKSPSDSILAILNFDYCVETIIKAVLLDTNIALRKRSRPKSFNELIEDLKNTCTNLGYMSEVLSLHKLRNDVQHHSLIPSKQEVARHVITVRSFFDEICSKVYDGAITFADISFALFIGSEAEKLMLAEMEKALQNERYSDSVYFAKQTVSYHVELLHDNMKVPHAWHSSFLRHHIGDSGVFRELGEFIEDTDKKLDWIVDRLCLREYHDEIYEFLGRSRYFPIKREVADKDVAERGRNITYDFITSTQDLIHKLDLEHPYIFDLTILDKSETECSIQIGIADASKIVEASLELQENGVAKYTRNISTNMGLQTFKLQDLKKGKTYHLIARVKNENEKAGHNYLNFKMD